MKKAQKSAVYLYQVSLRESQDTKLILAPWFTVGVARVTQNGLLLKISQKSVAEDTIDGIYLQFSKNSFTFPVVS